MLSHHNDFQSSFSQLRNYWDKIMKIKKQPNKRLKENLEQVNNIDTRGDRCVSKFMFGWL